MPEDATVASALAIAQAYAIEADASHAIVAPSGFRYSGIAWTGAGTGRERPFGLGFRSDDVLLLAFRGTADIADLLADLHAREAPFEGAPPGQPVTLMGVAGFESVYHSMRAAVHEIVSTIGPERLHLTGHSLGAALATYLCADLLLDAHVPPPRIDLTLWAPPKPGNAPFADVLRAHRDAGQVNAKALVNVHDVVPKYPFSHHYLHPFPPTLLDFGDTFDVLGNHHLDNYLQAYRQGSAHRAPVVPTHEEEYAT
jgi:hypothetical protein